MRYYRKGIRRMAFEKGFMLQTSEKTTARRKWQVVKRLTANFILREKLRVVAALCCTVAAGLATAGIAAAAKPLLDFIFVEKRPDLLLPVVLMILALLVARECTSFGQAVLMNALTRRISSSIRAGLFEKIVNADLAFFHENASGKIVSRISADVNLLRSSISSTLVSLSRDSFIVICLLALMVYRDPVLSLPIILGLLAAVSPVKRLGRQLRRITKKRMRQAGSYSGRLNEIFTYIRAVKASVMENAETRETKRMLGDIERAIHKSVVVQEAVGPTIQLFMGLSIVASIYYGGHLVVSGKVSPGHFFSFMAALVWLLGPLRRLASSNLKLQEGLAAAERIYSLMDMKAKIDNAPMAKPLEYRGGAIRFERVNFFYPGVRALFDVNLEIPAGKTTALVGPSGAGKSTILDLILRFHEVSDGAVLVDGQDVRSVTLESLRRQIGLVSQEPPIFDSSIVDNIRYGTPSATDEEVQRVSRIVGAHKFIERLANGYHTKVGPRGSKLSGGQRQLIAFARAMLRNPPILLLDEPTASLDSKAEEQVRSALRQLMTGRTVVMIAHRLSTVTQADQICVLNDGQIVEIGRHADLLRSNGLYSRLHQLQVGSSQAPSLTLRDLAPRFKPSS